MTLVVDLCQRPLSRSEYVDPIAAIVGDGARVVGYDEVDVQDVDASPAVILCGTALADDGYLDHLDRFGWLLSTGTPVLGICAGMQVIALLHGAQLVERGEIGMTTIEPVEQNPLVTDPMEVYSLHKYDLEDLEAFRVLARSRDCIQAISHHQRPLHGILFHPEVRRGGVVSRFLSPYA